MPRGGAYRFHLDGEPQILLRAVEQRGSLTRIRRERISPVEISDRSTHFESGRVTRIPCEDVLRVLHCLLEPRFCGKSALRGTRTGERYSTPHGERVVPRRVERGGCTKKRVSGRKYSLSTSGITAADLKLCVLSQLLRTLKQSPRPYVRSAGACILQTDLEPDFFLEHRRHTLRQAVLRRDDVGARLIEILFGRDLAGVPIDETYIDEDAIVRGLHRATNDRAHLQCLRETVYRNIAGILPSIRRDATRRHDIQSTDFRKAAYQALRESIGQVAEVAIHAHVLEIHDCQLFGTQRSRGRGTRRSPHDPPAGSRESDYQQGGGGKQRWLPPPARGNLVSRASPGWNPHTGTSVTNRATSCRVIVDHTLLELLLEVRDRREPIRRRLGQRFLNDVLDLVGYRRTHDLHRRNFRHGMAGHDRLRIGTGEGRFAHKHLVQDAGEAVHVASSVDVLLRECLLWAHVRW